ncbi:MAG: acyl-CoA dehydrogenase [Firmicutes bacterium]|nr:acyl-CoA dehydrogenase [Bacillota bacterium]
MLFLNPRKYRREFVDERSREIMLKTIDFFEKKGLKSIKEDDRESKWHEDFLAFIKKEQIFASLLTPEGYGDPGVRFDLSRVCEFTEITAFYSLAFQYCYQVSILGLGPIWMGDNEELKKLTGRLLKEGGIFAFGMSEKEHGADLYSNEMTLEPRTDGTYLAGGSKYYIGNANEAALVSCFAKHADSGDFVFFVVNPQHEKYELVKKIETSGVRPAYVGEFNIKDYPVTKDDIASEGRLAWDSSLSTINIGKFQLGFASVGICEHAFYEALDHAAGRTLYNKKVTDFSHIKKLFVESYARIVAMKLFALRAVDYFRSSSEEDRRYLLFNPIQKMKVTTQGMKVVDMLLDAIAAKGFEQDTYFELAIRDIGMIPRLEGTTHVNMALVIKFMANYFFNPIEYPDIPRRQDVQDDANLFRQTTGKLAKIKFPDYSLAYREVNLPNASIFLELVELFREMLATAPPNEEQSSEVDYMLHLGEMFTMIVYAQLVLENAKIYDINDDLLNQMLGLMVEDYAHYALSHMANFANTPAQEKLLQKMLKKPVLDPDRLNRVWEEQVYPLKGQYITT